jgi:hypothetical protein
MYSQNKYYSRKLTLHTEIFLYTAPVPYVVFFVILTAGFGLSDLIPIFFCVTLVGITSLFIGIFQRRYKLEPLLEASFSGKIENAEQLKIDLLHYTKFESIMSAVRWYLSGFLFLFLFSFCLELPKKVLKICKKELFIFLGSCKILQMERFIAIS